MTEMLLLAYGAAFLAIASPGPSNMAIMATAMSHGRGQAMTLALGISAGSLTWGCLAAGGVTTLLAANANALYAIKIAGGLYLLYLAFRAGRSALATEEAKGRVAPVASTGKTFLRGYLMHITNPKAILGWTAIIAIGLPPDPSAQQVFSILGGCALISLTSNSTYALLFSTAPIVAGYRRCRRWIDAALAGVFAFAGLRLIATRF
ncbi:MAG: LysE family translocator [Proteobacteria bacterium]|nr:LysE family translocator [Pseudomonadota bacterium]